MKLKRLAMMGAGLLLTIGDSLADAVNTSTNTTSTDIIGNLGVLSSMANFVLVYAKYIAFLIAVITLLALWATGNLAKWSHKIEAHINAKDGLKSFFVESFLVVIGFIVLFRVVIPMINSFITGTSATI